MAEARRAVAEALVRGRALRIEGGNYAVLLRTISNRRLPTAVPDTRSES
ncbi:MAG: hypothetical protein V8Q84_09690 [Bilophila sp.]